MINKGEHMTWIFLTIGLVVGAGTGGGITYHHMKKKIANIKPIVVKEVVAEKQQDVILQLTDLELAKQICEKENNELLCREILCLQFTRGIDSKTNHCEEIANLNNSIQIMDYCEKTEDKEKCLDIFWRRK
tara:strand:- start:75 stop:467 length:393 start_codon:yes stop_codon:yes gene_type:complete